MNTLNKTKKYVYFIGIDISKETLDIAVMVQGSILIHNTISNEPKAIKDHMMHLKASFKFTTRNAVVGMENTGIYSNRLTKNWRHLKSIPLWIRLFILKIPWAQSGAKPIKKMQKESRCTSTNPGMYYG